MLVDLDVVIDPDAALLPFGVHVGLDRQRFEHRPVDIIEQHASARAQMPRHTLVECCDAVADRVVQLGDREEPAIAQLGDDPARGQQHGHLDLGFVARLASACWPQSAMLVMSAIKVIICTIDAMVEQLVMRNWNSARHPQ